MKMKYLISVLLVLFLLMGCKGDYKPETIIVNNDFSLTIMNYLKKTDELKPGAPFQYCNRFRNLYVVAFSYPKKNSFDTTYLDAIAVLKGVLKNPKINEKKTVALSGMKAVQTEIFGEMQKENIYYSHELIEGKDNYYEVCAWTRGEERKLHYNEAIDNILNSFKLIAK